MIIREHRFHGYSSLRYVYRHGLTVRGPLAALRYTRNNRQKSWRAAVVVSRKVSKSAVVRNRIRRRVFEIIRLHQQAIHEPYDMVFIIFSQQLTELDSPKLTELVMDLLLKARIITAHDLSSKPAERAIVETKEK